MDNSAGKNASSARRWLKIMGSPSVLFYALPWLMILLVIGTVAQKEMGLFAAQKLFFSSLILWMGPIPLPGAYLTLGIITVCLLIKFIMFSKWNKAQSGIILTHLGVLILLIGGMVTAVSQTEGFILIGEGQTGNAVSDYHARILRIEKNGVVFKDIPFETLETGTLLDLPFKVEIISVCENCRPAPVKDVSDRKGLAEQIELVSTPSEKEAETNLSGTSFRISGTEDDGTYVVMEEIPHKPEVKTSSETYRFSVGRNQTILPFSIELKDFHRDLHPGTDMARGFSSDIVVKDGDASWPYTIRMNDPLRYKGYTFYQASFSIRPDGEYSVLSVVRNKGRIFPYAASVIIFLGLLLHVVLRARRKTA